MTKRGAPPSCRQQRRPWRPDLLGGPVALGAAYPRTAAESRPSLGPRGPDRLPGGAAPDVPRRAGERPVRAPTGSEPPGRLRRSGLARPRRQSDRYEEGSLPDLDGRISLLGGGSLAISPVRLSPVALGDRAVPRSDGAWRGRAARAGCLLLGFHFDTADLLLDLRSNRGELA